MSTGRLIMVIEDDHKTAELVRLYLERDGHAVLVSHDGYEGPIGHYGIARAWR